jgi:hypothetical protein
LIFAHHLAARAGELARHYNAALAAYRRDTGGTDPNRPMPDLTAGPDSVALPLWVDDLRAGKRSRPTLFSAGDGWTLDLVGGESFHFDPGRDANGAAAALRAFLDTHGLRLAPRALMLTTFVRLAVVDQFVHGIGGARYDQVTDRLIRSFFDLEPPAFSVSTATLRFPTSVGKTRTCVECLAHEGHQLKHALLGERKRELLGRIDSQPRRSRARLDAFLDMHRQLKAADDAPIRAWRQRYETARVAAVAEADEFSRELFYVLQPRERLVALIERVRNSID